MKALITGLAGFVGPYLKKELESHGYEVFGLDRNNSDNLENGFCGDICDRNFVNEVVGKVKPDKVFHLAGFSSVKKSFDKPELTMQINVDGTRNVLSAVELHVPSSKILIVSSAEVYGNPESNPIKEDALLKITSPYSESRIKQEELIKEYKDLFVVVSRSFNHTGPGQSETFVLPDFIKQAVEIENGVKDPVIYVGNLDVVRDFSDVRDVVKAYNLLLEKGKKGEFYNVGSGIGYKLSDLLNVIKEKALKDFEIKVDPEKFRPVEIKELVADISKVQNLGYRQGYLIDRTIEDLLNYSRNK